VLVELVVKEDLLINYRVLQVVMDLKVEMVILDKVAVAVVLVVLEKDLLEEVV
tara:strand:+ start:88 stop:246 length:159 start_codon:yes stop_codon:yes gene_type:complete